MLRRKFLCIGSNVRNLIHCILNKSNSCDREDDEEDNPKYLVVLGRHTFLLSDGVDVLACVECENNSAYIEEKQDKLYDRIHVALLACRVKLVDCAPVPINTVDAAGHNGENNYGCDRSVFYHKNTPFN